MRRRVFLSLVIRLSLVSKTLNKHGLGEWWRARITLIKDKFREMGWFLGNTSIAGTLRMAKR